MSIQYNQFRRRYNDEQLRKVIQTSKTWKELALVLGLTPSGSNYKTLRNNAIRIKESTDHLLSSRLPANPEYIKKWKQTREIANDGVKTCSDCCENKHVTDFYIHRGGAKGRSNLCKVCQNTRSAYEAIKRLYGLEKEEYDKLAAKGCNICGKKKGNRGRKLSVDHCHTTNKIRGVLCDSCNFMIGLANDNPDILNKAISYLKG